MDQSAQEPTVSNPSVPTATPPPVTPPPPPAQPEQPPTPAAPVLPSEHHHFMLAIVLAVVLVILGGLYAYFILFKPKPASNTNSQNTVYPTPQQLQATPDENPFTTPTTAYENPFDASASSNVTDTPYQNPFAN